MNKAYFDKDVKTVRGVLERVLKIYETAAWIQRDFAKTKDGISCTSFDVEATKFCLMSAIKATTSANNHRLIFKVETAILNDINKHICCQDDWYTCIMVWNDDVPKSKRQVVNLVKRVLKTA